MPRVLRPTARDKQGRVDRRVGVQGLDLGWAILINYNNMLLPAQRRAGLITALAPNEAHVFFRYRRLHHALSVRCL